ncbi:MAG: VOC family protein [Chloroflexi bacterium]|nr:VOC family protein [Chloroflexota bacterium]MDA8189041.1 VOC family protein [Dehalococcoidales bacterium]
MKVRKFDHICIAVKNLEEARKPYEEILGLVPDILYVAESEKIKVARYYLGDVALELMESTSPDGEVAKFIEKKGEGVFLLSYRVDDVQECLDELNQSGYNTIDKKPRSIMGQRFAFINHPREMCGVLTEVCDHGD